jgi:hypothetical protein
MPKQAMLALCAVLVGAAWVQTTSVMLDPSGKPLPAISPDSVRIFMNETDLGGFVKKCVNARQAAAFWVDETAGTSRPSA